MKRPSAPARPPASELLIRTRLQALVKALPAARNGDVLALHQARVASRRMREALPLVASGGGAARKVERRLRRITRVLGPVRELDVALLMLDQLVESGGASPRVVNRLRQAVANERQQLQREMRRRLERCDVGKLRKRAIAVSRHRADSNARETTSVERLAKARARAARRAERLHAAMESASGIYLPDRLHEVRIAVKKLRYSLELVQGLGRSRSTGHVRTLKRAQDLLGRMHDLEVLIARTRALQSSSNAPTLKVSAELDRLVRGFETECRQLHGHYITERAALLAVCEHAIAAAARHDRNAA